MSYYADKKKANHIIDSMVKEGKTFGEVVYKINTLFGYGSSIVKQRLIILRNAGVKLGDLEDVL